MRGTARICAMTISKDIINVLVDLVENKLSCMQISDRDDMREVMILQRCLNELNAGQTSQDKMIGGLLASDMPRRGRKRRYVAQIAS
jgi:hypothetical protein